MAEGIRPRTLKMRGGEQMDLFATLAEAARESYEEAMASAPVCRCRGSQEKGYRLAPDTGWWVHALCGMPSRLYYERVIAS